MSNTTLSPQIHKSHTIRHRFTQCEKIFYETAKHIGITLQYEKKIKYYNLDKQIKYFLPDFYYVDETKSVKIIIEIDGNSHEGLKAILDDDMRDAILKKRGYVIKRFTNQEIKDNVLKCVSILQSMIDAEIDKQLGNIRGGIIWREKIKKSFQN